MIVFRHGDPRFPFLWESAAQPAARWHADGDGPVHYFADTPDGAWAEFLRHEEITEPADLAYVRRAVWAVDLPTFPRARPKLIDDVLLGGPETYAACRAEAQRLRRTGAKGLRAPSAALKPGTAGGWRVQGGLRPGPERDGMVIVLFGMRPELVGWFAADRASPPVYLLYRVRWFWSSEN